MGQQVIVDNKKGWWNILWKQIDLDLEMKRDVSGLRFLTTMLLYDHHSALITIWRRLWTASPSTLMQDSKGCVTATQRREQIGVEFLNYPRLKKQIWVYSLFHAYHLYSNFKSYWIVHCYTTYKGRGRR